MVRFEALTEGADPFQHWVGDGFLTPDTISQINQQWPKPSDPRWHRERGKTTSKGSILFPRALPEAANAVAEHLYSPGSVARLSAITGINLMPDPWFKQGPEMPRLGGGLHEIVSGGFLKMHVDFTLHPAGVERALNLLIYLNEDWDEAWGGALELHGATKKTIPPIAGRAVMFPTHDESWHGHPDPLTCPDHRARRSLALYYYKEGGGNRPNTVYRKS